MSIAAALKRVKIALIDRLGVLNPFPQIYFMQGSNFGLLAELAIFRYGIFVEEDLHEKCTPYYSLLHEYLP